MGPSAGNQAETPNFSTLPGCPHIVIITRNFRQVSPENRQTFAFQVPLSRQSCRYPCHKNCRRGIPRQLRFNLLLSCPPRLLFSSGKKRWRHRKAKVCRHLWVYNLEQSKVGPGGVRKGYGTRGVAVGSGMVLKRGQSFEQLGNSWSFLKSHCYSTLKSSCLPTSLSAL